MAIGEAKTPETGAGLLAETPLDAFDAGEAAALVTRRNRHVGNLVSAERAVWYTQILYRMLLFRRDHELEPLYEDIHDAVRRAQDRIGDGDGYAPEQFRADLGQLASWDLVSCRIELERLRGYRDSRRRKFRYSLSRDALAFLEWLEERLQADLEEQGPDTRDILEEVCVTLRELCRLLERFGTNKAGGGDERRILYQLLKADELSLQANAELSAFNGRLLGFVVRHYTVDEAKSILRQLDDFVQTYLRQIHHVRGEIVSLLSRLGQERCREKLEAAVLTLGEERKRAPHILRPTADLRRHQRMPVRLREFYRANGRLDALCRRVEDSALRVWRKLHSHLRELERRSNRVEDLRARTREMAKLGADDVPHRFLIDLIGSGAMRSDPHYWDEDELADPPQPRRRPVPRQVEAPLYLNKKRPGRGAVMSIEQARLLRLRHWLDTTIGLPLGGKSLPVSQGAFTEPEDFAHIMDVAKAGLLGGGRKLRRIKYRLTPVDDQLTSVDVGEARLSFAEMMLERL